MDKPRPKRLVNQKNMSGMERYQLYTMGFTLIDSFIDSDDIISAYLLTFSIFEDRITQMFYRRKLQETGMDADSEYLRETGGGLQQQLFYLSFKGDITENMLKKIRNVVRDRNCLIHQTVLNLNNFEKENVIRLKKLLREFDKISKQQKRDIEKDRTLSKTEWLKNRLGELNFKRVHLEKQIARVEGKMEDIQRLR